MRAISGIALKFVMTMMYGRVRRNLQVLVDPYKRDDLQLRHGCCWVRAMTSAAGLPKPPTRPASLAARVWREFEVDHCTLLAASIAYHVLFSLVPLMTLTLAIMGYLLRDTAAREAVYGYLVQAMPVGAVAVFESIRAVS